MDMSRIGPILTGDPYDLGDGPPVTAMLIQNTNPAVVAPETSKVREGNRTGRPVRLCPRAVPDRHGPHG